MELKKEDIQILRTKSKASSQVTFDVDYNVPDVKPDIGRMIQNKGEMTVEEVRLNEGHAFLKGKLQAGNSVGVILNLGEIKIQNYMVAEKVTHHITTDHWSADLRLIGGEFI